MGARIGPHVNRYHAGASAPLAEHVAAARREAEASGLEIGAAAVFVGGPRERRLTLRPGEAAGLRELGARTGLRLVAHSAYCANPWQEGPADAAFIRSEAEACQAAGIGGLVIHLPKRPPAEVLKFLPRLLTAEAPDVVLYLETPAVVPRETYYETPSKLGGLFGQARALDPGGRLGLCVDTAHLWTSGVDLRTYADADAWFRGLEAQAPAIPRVMLHCNDSARERGRGPDTHAQLGRGKIWESFAGGMQQSGLAAALDYATRHESTVILERKPKEALKADYLTVRGLVAGPDSKALGPAALRGRAAGPGSTAPGPAALRRAPRALGAGPRAGLPRPAPEPRTGPPGSGAGPSGGGPALSAELEEFLDGLLGDIAPLAGAGASTPGPPP